MVNVIIPTEQEFLMENDSTYRQAVDLASHMVKIFYPEGDTFILCDSTAGVISQIDNMVTGLERVKS